MNNLQTLHTTTDTVAIQTCTTGSSYTYMERMFSLLLILTLCLGMTCCAGATDIAASTLACHESHYEYIYNNTLISPTGTVYHCMGPVRVLSCWGRCDSQEVPDYRMPYTVPNHPVCTFSTRRTARVRLAYCHPDHPNPEVEVVEAGGCACMPCSSTDTSCLSLPWGEKSTQSRRIPARWLMRTFDQA